MPSYLAPDGEHDRYNSLPHSYDYGRPRSPRAQDTRAKPQSPQPPRTRRRWPPAPTVEDEQVSLSREHFPKTSISREGEAQMKGSVDQLPVLVEIGKEHEIEPEISDRKKERVKPNRRSSSEDSFGPDTPTDSSASESNTRVTREDRGFHAASVASSIKDAMDGKWRPDASRRTESMRLPERGKTSLHSPSPATFQRSSSSRDAHATLDPQHLYPGTVEELKAHPSGKEYLGYAERQRTMSGSNNGPDHRPGGIRHMSAMGYAGESQTPSFQRDHPAMYTSPIGITPRSLPPAFREPRNRDHDAIVSSSDSEISPDEMYRKKTRQRTSSRSSNRSSTAYNNNSSRPSSKEPTRQHSRPSSPERRPDRNTITSESHRKRPQDSLAPVSKRSSASGSPCPSPTAASAPNSRPASRDDSHRYIYPSISKKPQQAQRTSRPSSPVGGMPTMEHHTASNLRYSSRPSSPTLSVSRESSYQKEAPKLESQGGRRDALKPKPDNLSEATPIQIPRSSRSPAPSLRVNVQQPGPIPPPKSAATPNPEMRHRPVSNEGANKIFNSSPTVPMSAPLWTAGESRPSIPPSKSTPSARPARLGKGQIQLITCPRPGFTTKHDDWWTIPQIADLDLCPDCKESLQDNGFSASFTRAQKRLPGTRTRCDMNVPWVRIACLLVLSGRETPEILDDIMAVLASEEPCPGIQGGIRKKWYRVYDDDADKHVSNFSVCPCCVRSIRVLFPNLKGTFNSHTATSQQPKICDLTASVPRFAKYIDLLDSISHEAKIYREEPDTKKFIRMSRDFAGIRPCPRDDQFRGVAWHYIPHIPDFTICQECFMEVVRPAQRAGSEVAEHVGKKVAMPPDINRKLSCQLYSPRMRAIFEECCRNQDVASLREHAMARVMKERELQNHVDTVRNYPEELQEQEMGRLIEEWKRWE